MPETLTSHEGEDFVAPDDSQRVEDPEVAERMARYSNQVRSEAAQMRADQRDPKIMRSPKKMEFAKSEEIDLDRMGDKAEELQKNLHEKEKSASTSGMSEVSILSRRPWLRDIPREQWPDDAQQEADKEGI